VRGLYAVTPDICETRRLVDLTRAALDGGVRLVQYRNKTAPEAQRLEQAMELKRLCGARNAALVINDHVDLAVAVDAAGVHLGKEDGLARDARRVIGPDKLIGVSCYDSLQRAQAAVADGADYVAFGSFFSSSVKPGAVRAPLELIARAKAMLGVPVVGIGGINHENAPALVAAGIDAVAVISALFGAADVAAAARRFTALFDRIP
jgi:thiamine-phosphate pyrophosphorylase